MKYYRIKLSLKGVKEKIWRLLYVPDYITFAQLAIIIDKVFGLDGDGEYHFFGHGLCYVNAVSIYNPIFR